MTDGDTTGLKRLDGVAFPVYASRGSESRAHAVAARATRAMQWLTENLGAKPEPVLLVVDPTDWAQVASIPLYGIRSFHDRLAGVTELRRVWRWR